MSPELATALLQFGIGGIFLAYLWKEVLYLREQLQKVRSQWEEERRRHTDEVDELRSQHRDEVKELRDEIAERDRARFKEATDYGTTLWQFTESVSTLAEHIKRQTRVETRDG